MIVLLYALATIGSAALAVRAPLADRRDPVRRAYALLAGIMAVVWLGWCVHLLTPGWPVGKLVNGTAATLLPYALLAFVDQFFGMRETGPRDRRLASLLGFAPFVAVAYALAELLAPWRFGQAGLSDLILGLWVFLGLGLSLRRLWQRHERSTQRVERARIRYLAVLAAAAIGFTALEAIVRAGGDTPGMQSGFLTQEGVVQGAVPPLGALLATTFLWFLYQMISLYRLLDLAEIVARVGAVSVAALLLVLLDSLSAVSLLGPYPTHGFFQAFVGSVLFLLAWDPLRNQLERWLGAVLNPRGLVLADAIREVESAVERAISLPALATTLLDRFVNTSRVRACALYLWDDERRLYRLVSERSGSARPALLQVARQPFVDGFLSGEAAYLRVDIERVARASPERGEALGVRLGLMAEMNADLVLPFLSGDVVLGWLALADEADSDGFSEEEVARIARLCLRASVTLENIQSFDQLKEEHRLSALDTMAAGLAHEIRNPLAGIRGAAQYLSSSVGEVDGEMVRVIVDETDRLNRIVAQFLDYARQLRLHVEDVSPEELVRDVARVVAAQNTSGGVKVVVEAREVAASLRCDPLKVRQVLLNLAQNALHAMENRSGTLTLRVEAGALRDPRARRTAAVIFSVVDEGVGVDPSDLDKLFVPFYTTRREGTGLGLAISQRIVQAHQGELDVRSEPGVGSTFTVRLPVEGGAVARGSATEARAGHGAAEPRRTLSAAGDPAR